MKNNFVLVVFVSILITLSSWLIPITPPLLDAHITYRGLPIYYWSQNSEGFFFGNNKMYLNSNGSMSPRFILLSFVLDILIWFVFIFLIIQFKKDILPKIKKDYFVYLFIIFTLAVLYFSPWVNISSLNKYTGNTFLQQNIVTQKKVPFGMLIVTKNNICTIPSPKCSTQKIFFISPIFTIHQIKIG